MASQCVYRGRVGQRRTPLSTDAAGFEPAGQHRRPRMLRGDPQECLEQDRLVPLLPAPQRAAAALAFSIVTHDDQGELKVRRGEDWRRSGHNGTTQGLRQAALPYGRRLYRYGQGGT